MLESLNEGRRCRLHYITEFSFGGNVPKGLVQTAACEKFMAGLAKLKKIMQKDHPD
jgi:hypothetical protein